MKTDYLRVSVTDRCNLRCIYCHPLGDCDFLGHNDILRFEEIYRIVRLFAQCGIRKVRITGGEPLVRRNIVYLIEQLAGIDEIDDLALTTNGVLLEPMAADLKNAGLHRVNVSMDSAERESYKKITGFDLLTEVTRGIDRAMEVGLSPIKINSVIIDGINVPQIVDLARMSVDLPIAVRFIEYCPTSRQTHPADGFVPTRRVRGIIENEFGMLSAVPDDNIASPATNYKINNAAGTIGFISGRSSVFCGDCNRLRLTSDGKIKPCLYSSNNYDLKKLIREGAGDEEVLAMLKVAITEKGKYTKSNSFAEEFTMRKIGG
jgi:cyclic pyranopterin phosphate synthase